MNFDDFKNRVMLVLRKKDDEEFTFRNEVKYFFLKTDYHVNELTIRDDESFVAKVSKRDWLSDSKEALPYIKRDVVGRKFGNELVLLVDESVHNGKYYYFEIYDKNQKVKNKLWMGDFLSDLDNPYYVSIIKAFEDDLSQFFLWHVKQKAKVLKKKIL